SGRRHGFPFRSVEVGTGGSEDTRSLAPHDGHAPNWIHDTLTDSTSMKVIRATCSLSSSKGDSEDPPQPPGPHATSAVVEGRRLDPQRPQVHVPLPAVVHLVVDHVHQDPPGLARPLTEGDIFLLQPTFGDLLPHHVDTGRVI